MIHFKVNFAIFNILIFLYSILDIIYTTIDLKPPDMQFLEILIQIPLCILCLVVISSLLSTKNLSLFYRCKDIDFS